MAVLLSRRNLIIGVVLAASVAGGLVGYRKWRKSRRVSTPTYVQPVQLSSRPPLPADFKLTAAGMTDFMKEQLRSPLDLEPQEWLPGRYRFKDPKEQFTFTADDMEAPSATEIA